MRRASCLARQWARSRANSASVVARSAYLACIARPTSSRVPWPSTYTRRAVSPGASVTWWNSDPQWFCVVELRFDPWPRSTAIGFVSVR